MKVKQEVKRRLLLFAIPAVCIFAAISSTNAMPEAPTEDEYLYEPGFYHDGNNYEYCVLEFMP